MEKFESYDWKKETVDPVELLTSLNGDNVKFLNLQYGNTDAEQAIFCDKNINCQTLLYGLDAHNDLEAMLAVISLCDEIVTVSNVTAHLAGSMGKNVAFCCRKRQIGAGK